MEWICYALKEASSVKGNSVRRLEVSGSFLIVLLRKKLQQTGVMYKHHKHSREKEIYNHHPWNDIQYRMDITVEIENIYHFEQ